MTDHETTPSHAAVPPAGGSPASAPTAERMPSAWDRFAASLNRLGARVSELVRRGNRRRLTLRDREGKVWIRLPLTLAIIVVILASASWASVLVVLAAIALFAFGFQVSIERAVGGVRTGPDAPTSAA